MTSTNGQGHTKGPYHFHKFAQSAEEVALMQKHGMKPTRMLTNEGQVAIMAGSGDDMKRVALIDCQTKYKRGEGYRTECAERDANARLIVAAPDLLEAIKPLAFSDADNPPLGVSIEDWRGAVFAARSALSRAQGGE